METRNLELASRNENTRDKVHTEVIKFALDEIKQHFNEALRAIGEQTSVADELLANGKTILAENIWRAQIVFLASAFDFYMHELTKYGLCEIYNDNWEKTTRYENIQVSMRIVEKALKSEEEIDWFLEYINDYYSKDTMVSFDSVKHQFNLLGIDAGVVADNAFYQAGASEKTKDKLKRRLNELFARRNIIAHQTDRKHANAQFQPIKKDDVQGFLSDVEKIVDAIDEAARDKEN